MIKIIYFFLTLVFLLSDSVYSSGYYSDHGVTPDFKNMLQNPSAPEAAGESFAVRVTRPFAADPDPDKDLSFFSNPKKSYGEWERRAGSATRINAFNIFEVMGVSRRGILIDRNPSYQPIADAEVTGMLGLMKGDLGFRRTPTSPAEKETMARELLNIGRSTKSSDLPSRIQGFKALYDSMTDLRK